jgi:hypothetical protein
VGSWISQQPSSTTWALVVSNASAPKFQSTKPTDGLALSKSEIRASSRHIGLKNRDPEPWIVQTNANPSSDTLAVMVELIHK